MSKNLALRFQHPDAMSHYVKYRRIDNAVNNPYISVSPNPTTSPAIIAEDVPNGQYEMQSTPVYADGRPCGPSVVYTDACPVLIAINAYMSGNNLVVSYLAPPDAPKVRIVVDYPNGGGSANNYVNTGDDIVIPVPANVFGDISVSGQTVCDETSGFYSPNSGTVTVNRTQTNLSITNNANGITVNNVTGITGYTLPQFIPYGESQSGNHQAFFGGFTVSFAGTPAGNSSATLTLNGSIIQCVNIPNTNGGTFSFSAVSYAAGDIIAVNLAAGLCPNPPLSGDYSYAVNEVDICAAAFLPLYHAFPYGPGTVMYTDAGLTTILSGFNFIRSTTDAATRNMNSGTGAVLNYTGNIC